VVSLIAHVTTKIILKTIKKLKQTNASAQ